jgi:hypothetical protein
LQDLGRDPAELLHRQLDNQRHMEERKEQLQQAAPGNNLDDMAAAGEGPKLHSAAEHSVSNAVCFIKPVVHAAQMMM